MEKMRQADHPILPLILNRWSPRAMTGQELSDDVIDTLFEAARWAPSSSNKQPWRFVYAKRNTPAWDTLFGLLVDFNKVWCKNAALLAVMISEKVDPKTHKTSLTHALDTGASWENIALQGNSMGLVIHGMAGFNYDLARTALNIPENFEVLAMFAAGHPAPRETLPADLQVREVPSTRNPISSFAFEGTFK